VKKDRRLTFGITAGLPIRRVSVAYPQHPTVARLDRWEHARHPSLLGVESELSRCYWQRPAHVTPDRGTAIWVHWRMLAWASLVRLQPGGALAIGPGWVSLTVHQAKG
jgi:hypothetical protein